MPSQVELVTSMRDILKNANLDTLTAKQVRNKLKEEYKCDVTEHKKFIDATLMELLDELDVAKDDKKREPSPEKEDNKKKAKVQNASSNIYTDSDKGDLSSEDAEFVATNSNKVNKSTKRKKNTSKIASIVQSSDRACKKSSLGIGSKNEVRVSPELAKIVGAEVLPRSEISLRLHQEVLSRRLHESSDRMYIACDEEFKAVFGLDRLRASTLTNHCKKHIYKLTKEELNEKQPVKRKATGYMKPVWLSPQLAEVLGYNHMSRASVIKEMWKLIKSRSMQDPKNKRFMLVDESMMPIFKSTRINTFGMMKYLTNHMATEEDEFTYYKTFPEYDPEKTVEANGAVVEGS